LSNTYRHGHARPVCSAAASRVPQRTNSSFILRFRRKYVLVQPALSVTSSCRHETKSSAHAGPLMNPGRTSRPCASIVCAP
jgi:hypothetical protein